MELIDQHTKKIMEGCKERARAAGLQVVMDRCPAQEWAGLGLD